MKKILFNCTVFGLCLLIVILLVCLLVRQVREHLLQDDPMLKVLREILAPVHPVVNNLKMYRGDKSYTINKTKVFLCLRDDRGEYYPLNMLVYVTLHEIAHVLNTKDVGHTETFHQIFDDLLERAQRLGVYNPEIPVIDNYCNHN